MKFVFRCFQSAREFIIAFKNQKEILRNASVLSRFGISSERRLFNYLIVPTAKSSFFPITISFIIFFFLETVVI